MSHLKMTSPFKSVLGRQFSRLLAAELCASAVVMLDTPCSEVVWRVLATHSIRQFPLQFPSRASPCAITFQLDSTHRVGLGGRHSRSGEAEKKVRSSVQYNIFRARSARLCMLFKLNGTRKHEWTVRHSLNTAANYSKNRQSMFVNEVWAPFVGGGAAFTEMFYSNRGFCADWIQKGFRWNVLKSFRM